MLKTISLLMTLGFLNFQAPVGKTTSLFVSKDLSKWILVSQSLKMDQIDKSDAWVSKESFQLYYDSKSHFLLAGKGFSTTELQQITHQLQTSSTSFPLFQLWIQSAYANADCADQPPRALSNGSLVQAQDWSRKISAQNILSACEWNPVEIAKQAVSKIVQDVQGLLSLDVLKKIDEVIQTLKSFVTEFKEKILPALSHLAESAPDLVNTWSCEKIRNHVPLIAMSLVVPQAAARQVALSIYEVLKDVQLLVSLPVQKSLKKIAQMGVSDPHVNRVISGLRKDRPAVFNDLKLNNDNFIKHEKKHASEFKNDDLTYAQRVQNFAKREDTHDVYFSQGDTFVKFNDKTGKMLVVDEHGKFITFYEVNGATPEDRFLNFLVKQASKEKRLLDQVIPN